MKKKRKTKLNKKYIFLAGGFLVLFLGSIGLYYRLDPSLFARISFYLDLANPSVKVVRVQEGLRREQVAEVMGAKLGWDALDKEEFLKLHLDYNTPDAEGMYFPKTYLVNQNDDPTEVSAEMSDE